MKPNILFITISLLFFSCQDQADTSSTFQEKESKTPITEESGIIQTEQKIDKITSQTNIDTTIEKITKIQSVLKEESVQIESSEIIETNNITELTTVESEVKIEETIIKNLSTTPNHDLWNSILKSNVSSSGKVNYVRMKSKLNEIEVYISTLESFSDQSTWSKNEKLAYWINLYNAVTVRLIIQNYPTTSITTINNGKPWDKKVVTISGKSYTLNQIENDIIRPRFNEPRIHFAVNCAAISCPKIMNSAFTAHKLDYQLTKQAKAFINGSKNSISKNSIEISKIFEWYAVDFGTSIIDYLNTYATTEINSTATITYKEYNWDLNE